jgi:hypothetical protein
MPYRLDSSRGSDTTLDTLSIDTDKHGYISEKVFNVEHHIHDATVPNTNIAKGGAKNDAEGGLAAPGPTNLMDPSSFPDGGLQAWLCLLGAFCAMFVSFGMLIIHATLEQREY